MKKRILALAVGSMVLSAGASASGGAGDGEWNWFAGLDDDYVMEPTASLLLGSLSFNDGDSGSVAGVELSFNCPLLTPPTNKIRQQLSIVQYDEAGTDVTSIEINPHYVVEVSPGLFVGGGPGFGYMSIDTAGGDDSVLGVQVGGSVHYNLSDTVFLGADARYQLTQDANFGATTVSMDNWRIALKAGVSF